MVHRHVGKTPYTHIKVHVKKKGSSAVVYSLNVQGPRFDLQYSTREKEQKMVL